MSGPPKKVAKSDVGTPRSSLLRKSVRVDRGDGGPPSNFKRWENCATQERRERVCCLLVLNLVSSTLLCICRPRPRLRVLDKCSTAISDTLGMHVRPVGVYVGNVVLLRLWWDEGDSRHSVAQFARRSRDS
jgi:hypothetical protein